MKALMNWRSALAALALAAAALCGSHEPSQAAFGQVLCAPNPVASADGPRRVVNPVTTTAYGLNPQGCAFIAQADVGYFISQGFTPGPRSFELALTGITANTTASNSPILPAGAYIDNIIINETAGNAVTGGVDVGTAASGAQVVSAKAVGANGLIYMADTELLKRVFAVSNLPGPQQIFFTCHTACNSASLNIAILYSLY